MESLRAVEAGGRELDPLEVRGVDELFPRDRLRRGQRADDPAADLDLVRRGPEESCRDLPETAEDLLARILDGPAVEVGAGARRRRRGVGDLVRARGGEPHG
ncbi:Uncharacterised protein [Mycobacteroides abscessus subsp. abscessus]|nr:Uncharacterised protein [Mycobacteroides abscessus subsp. abscessus]